MSNVWDERARRDRIVAWAVQIAVAVCALAIMAVILWVATGREIERKHAADAGFYAERQITLGSL